MFRLNKSTSPTDEFRPRALCDCFITDIFSGLGEAFGVLKGITGDISQGINFGVIATALQTLVTVVTNITGSIDQLVTSVSSTLHDVVDPITKAVDSVAQLGQDIEDKIIAPIVGPITTTIKEIDTVTKTVNKLVDGNIQDLLEIPKAISDALTGIAGSFDRSSQQLATSYDKIAKDTIIPGFDKIISPGLEGVSTAFLKFSEHKTLDPDKFASVRLLDERGEKELVEFISSWKERLRNPSSWIEALMAFLPDAIMTSAVFAGTIDSLVEQGRAASNRGNPSTTLDPGTTVEAFKRGVISKETAGIELARKGFDEARQTILFDVGQFLPAIDTVGDWFRRGLITHEVAIQLARQNGLDADAIRAWLASLDVLIPPGTLLDWLARGIIDQERFDNQLEAQGYDAPMIMRLIKGGISPLSVNVAIAAHANRVAGEHRFFEGTYLSPPPQEVIDAAHASRVDAVEAARAWQAHWNVLPIPTAITLWQRGDLTRSQVKIVVEQNGFPPELTDQFIAAQTELISARSVPTLVEDGELDEHEARSILKSRGFDDHDANLLVDHAVALRKAKQTKLSTEKTKLSVGELQAAFRDSIIDEDTYRHLLTTHGLVGEDLELTVALDKFAINKALKTDEINTIEAEVKLGLRSIDDALDELGRLGLTPHERERIAVRLKQTKRGAAKTLDVSQLDKALLSKIIDKDRYIAGLKSLGYSDDDAEILFKITTG